MAVKTYDPSHVAIWFGTIQIQGFAEDAAISIEHDEDDWSLAIGVDGEGTRSKTSNASATITVSLMQSSDTNALLSAHRELDRLTPGGIGGLPFIVRDRSGSSLYTAETAWVQRAPTAEFSRESTTREWVFRTDNLIALHAGN